MGAFGELGDVFIISRSQWRWRKSSYALELKVE